MSSHPIDPYEFAQGCPLCGPDADEATHECRKIGNFVVMCCPAWPRDLAPIAIAPMGYGVNVADDIFAIAKPPVEPVIDHPAGCFYGSFAEAYPDNWHIPYGVECELDHGDNPIRLLAPGASAEVRETFPALAKLTDDRARAAWAEYGYPEARR